MEEKIPFAALEKTELPSMACKNETSLFDTNFIFYPLYSLTVTSVSKFC